MPWTIEFDARAKKELAKLDRPVQTRILAFLRQRIATEDDPQRHGKGLRGKLTGLWRYRVGDYRILCRIETERHTVFVIAIEGTLPPYRGSRQTGALACTGHRIVYYGPSPRQHP